MANDLPFIDPTAGGGKARIVPAPRPMDLAGKVVGLLDNTKEQGDVILETVAAALQRTLRRRESHHPPQGALLEARDAEIINEMAKEVQVAVAAVGG
jgi:hypothetical protein